MGRRRIALAASFLLLVVFGSFALERWRGGARGAAPGPAGAAAPRAAGAAEGGGGFGGSPGGGRAAPRGAARRILGPAGERGASVAGTVLDPDGKPIEGATVRARLETAAAGTMAATAADGTYEIAGLEAGTYQIEARAAGLCTETLAGVRLEEGERVRGLDFVLDRGERVLGSVLDDKGAPVAGARVEARPARGPRDAEPEAAAATAPDGGFEMTGLTLGKKELTATAPGFRRSAPALVEVTPRGAPRVELRLERGAFIAGRVTRKGDGAPVAGARVVAEAGGGFGGMAGGRGDGGEALSGEDGRYRIEGLAGRRFRVTATPPERGFAPAVKEGVRPDTSDCDLVIEAGASLAGLVVKAGSAEPIEGAQVSAGDRSPVPATTTGPDGTFLLAGIPPGKVELRARAAERAEASVAVEVGAGEQKSGIVIELAEGGVIEGRVVRASDRAALAGAIVRVVGGRGGRGGGEEMLVEALASGAELGEFVAPADLEELLAKNAVTDSRGRFRLGGLKTGDHIVYAAHADHPGASARATIGAAGEKKEIEIALPEGGSIAGRVVGEGGAPTPEEAVVAFSFTGRVRTAKTDPRGEYAIRGLAPGSYFVSLGLAMRARLGGGGRTRVDPDLRAAGAAMSAKTANVEAGRVTRVDFAPEEQTLVTGRVLRGDAPVEGQFVQFFPEGGGFDMRGFTTDAEGRYQVELTAGRYVVRVQNWSEPLEVPAGLPRLEKDLRLPQGALEGRVLNAATAEPVRARVDVYKAERKGATESLAGILGAVAGDTRTDGATGAFRLGGLAPGGYTVVARADGFAEARLDGVEVPPEGTASGIELALEPGGVFRGRVLDGSSGEPVPHPTIWIVDVTAPDLPSGEPPRGDEDGRFEIRRFAPGKYRVTVLEESHAPWRELVDFPGGEVELAPVLLRGGTLEVTVLDGASGAPLPGALVDLRYPDGERVITGFFDFVQGPQPAGPDGKVRRPRLPQGPLQGTVTVAAPGGAPGAPARQARFEVAIVDRAEQAVVVRVP